MKKKPAKSKLRVKKPKKSDQMLVRQGHLNLVRKELKSNITSLQLEMKAGFKSIESRFKSIDARFDAIDARFLEIDARFLKIDARFIEIDARFEKLENKLNQMLILMEEQKEQNKFVLDGYMILHSKLKEHDNQFEKTSERLDHWASRFVNYELELKSFIDKNH